MNDIQIDAALNNLYRNYPGWFYHPEDTTRKVAKAEEAKTPIIKPVVKRDDTKGTRKEMDCYDKAGSEIRNQLRGTIYNKKGCLV